MNKLDELKKIKENINNIEKIITTINTSEENYDISIYQDSQGIKFYNEGKVLFIKFSIYHNEPQVSVLHTFKNIEDIEVSNIDNIIFKTKKFLLKK